MNTQYTTRPTGYAVRNCADTDCGECPLNNHESCLMSDDHIWRKRNGWIRVPIMGLFREGVQHDNI